LHHFKRVINQPSPERTGVITVISGVLTGVAAGFIGVGGGEFRIPVLVELLAFPLKFAGGINLVVGLFTVALGVLRRWGQQAWTHDHFVLLGVMGGVSAIGSGVGVFGRERLPQRSLKAVVCVYLIVIGLWMLYESIAHVEHVLLEPTGILRWLLAALIAFAIAVVSGVLGVAGGEMRIPALLYLFAVPIREAGTLSLLISIPTLAAGALADRRLGSLPNAAVLIAVLMGVASAVGVVIGAGFLPYADRDLIKGTLGVVLLLATVRLTVGPAH
jgi:uncharacterized membrane protein YfcA